MVVQCYNAMCLANMFMSESHYNYSGYFIHFADF